MRLFGVLKSLMTNDLNDHRDHFQRFFEKSYPKIRRPQWKCCTFATVLRTTARIVIETQTANS
jgi:hypothetical protein